ncbi:dephospho-CoA kinase [Clostridia bacterium]|nr:dephospho-CoA kinase [Clostridia bacterium]
MIIGVTGQTGSGKTTFCNALRDLGFYVIDADKVAKEVTDKDAQCLKELAECFGDVIKSDGTLDRRKLGDIVFSDSDKLQRLNNIIFPYITERLDELIFCENPQDYLQIKHKYLELSHNDTVPFEGNTDFYESSRSQKCNSLKTNRESGATPCVVVDAPTLFESGFDKICDLIIAVIANSEEEQIERLIERDDITREQILNRIKSQKTKEFFYENADIIVNNKNMEDILDVIRTFKRVEN